MVTTDYTTGGLFGLACGDALARPTTKRQAIAAIEECWYR